VTAQSINVLATLDEWPGQDAQAPGAAAGLPGASLFARVLRGVEKPDGNGPQR
jgi:hypothetical protein